MKYFKLLFFASLSMVIGSFKAAADLPLSVVNSANNCFDTMTEVQEFLLTGDSILLVGFLLWIAYIVFFFPKDTFKKL